MNLMWNVIDLEKEKGIWQWNCDVAGAMATLYWCLEITTSQDHHSGTIFLYINTREFSLLVILISHKIEVKLPNIASLSLNSLMWRSEINNIMVPLQIQNFILVWKFRQLIQF